MIDQKTLDWVTKKLPNLPENSKKLLFEYAEKTPLNQAKKKFLIEIYTKNLPYIVPRFKRYYTKGRGVTLYRLMLRHGKNNALRMWKSYKEKQAYTNTLEYKQKRYGWTENQFKEYNANRSQTLENMIKRHGEELGKIKWREYCEKQKTAGVSLEYFIQKYGLEKGEQVYNEVNASKGLTLENFIKKYGETLGKEKFSKYLSGNHSSFVSIISQELFNKIDNLDEKTYYGDKSGEFGMYDDIAKRHYFLDYVNLTRKKCIEFNGDYWHCNPLIYDKDYIVHNKKASLIWVQDETKQQAIKRKFDLLIVWENDYLDAPEKVIEECRKFLYG